MFSKLRFTLLPLTAALLGCGAASPSSSGSSNNPPVIPTTTYNFNGTWYTFASASYPYSSVNRFLAALTVSDDSVTGTIVPSSGYGSGYSCAANGKSLPVSGTLDADHNLNLTFPIAGGTATIQATLADNPATYAAGSFHISGGTCPMGEIPMETYQTTPATPPSTPVATPITANLSGNWGINAYWVYTPYSYAKPVHSFGAALQFSNGSVTGTLNAFPDYNVYSCYYNFYNTSGPTSVPITGALDTSNHLTLTAPVAGGTATITATLGSNPQTLADGSYQIVNGACATPATPMTIAQYAPITGTYIGTVGALDPTFQTPIPGANSTVTAVVTQLTSPNSSGQFPISGTVTLTGACNATFSLPAGTVSGSGFGIINSTLTFDASAVPDASTLFDIFLTYPGCYFLQGNLTRQ